MSQANIAKIINHSQSPWAEIGRKAIKTQSEHVTCRAPKWSQIQNNGKWEANSFFFFLMYVLLILTTIQLINNTINGFY